jgi:hypothetical protein
MMNSSFVTTSKAAADTADEPWLTVGGDGATDEIVVKTPPPTPPTPQPPRAQPPRQLVIDLTRSERELRLLWCLQHRPFRVLRPTFHTTAPGDFGVPTAPIRPGRLRFYDRWEANEFCAGFLDETLRRSRQDPRCTQLLPCSVVHPSGEFRRCGPYLWARLRDDDWALIEIDLWPQLRSGACCVPRLLDLCGCIGVVPLVDNIGDVAAALPPNVYAGICRCEAW